MYIPIAAFSAQSMDTNRSIETDTTSISALQKSAIRASRSAFRPAVSTGLRAGAARFASDTALHGKIHQVIGAVVDGKYPKEKSFCRQREAPGSKGNLLTEHDLRLRSNTNLLR